MKEYFIDNLNMPGVTLRQNLVNCFYKDSKNIRAGPNYTLRHNDPEVLKTTKYDF